MSRDIQIRFNHQNVLDIAYLRLAEPCDARPYLGLVMSVQEKTALEL